MVPTPAPSTTVVPDGFARFTPNVSFSSYFVSPFTSTVKVCDVTPGGN